MTRICQIRSVLWLLIGCLLPLSSTCFSLQSRTQFLQWIGMLSINGDISEDASAICNNGALVPEEAAPGAYNQVCMNIPERILKINSQQVRIQQQASDKTGLAASWSSIIKNWYKRSWIIVMITMTIIIVSRRQNDAFGIGLATYRVEVLTVQVGGPSGKERILQTCLGHWRK